MSDPVATVIVDAANSRARDTIPGWELIETAADGTLLVSSPSGLEIRTAASADLPSRAVDVDVDGWGGTVSAGGRWIGYTSNVTEEAGFEIYLLRAEPPYDLFHVSPGGRNAPGNGTPLPGAVNRGPLNGGTLPWPRRSGR